MQFLSLKACFRLTDWEKIFSRRFVFSSATPDASAGHADSDHDVYDRAHYEHTQRN